MTTLSNEITINAPMDKIWAALTNIEELEKYDPTVKKSTAISSHKSGMGALRKVDMLDGKNWFEEKITAFEPNKTLRYELTNCSFPVNKLKHTYSFDDTNGQTTVKQKMEYEMKYGFLGRMMDALMVRKQFNSGIKKFFSGLKAYVENK